MNLEHLKGDIDPSKYRYRCPECGSVELKKRPLDSAWTKQLKEWREETSMVKLRNPTTEGLPEWRCHSCNAFVHSNERVDTSESERIGSFRYGGEGEWE